MSDATDIATATRTLHVDVNHPAAREDSAGEPDAPFATIQAAAAIVQPGDTVVIHAGVYRERVSPARGGEPGRPITFTAAPGQRVSIRGSEVFTPDWRPVDDMPHVLRGSLEGVSFGEAAYRGVCDPSVHGEFNPYHLNFNRERIARPHDRAVEQIRSRLDELGEKQRGEAEASLQTMTRDENRRYRTTLGQLFIDGQPMREVDSAGQLQRMAGTWMVDPAGEAILLHPPRSVDDPAGHLVELSVRHTAFAPLTRGLGHIHLRHLTFEHAANHFPTWGGRGWAQAGLVSCRSGHHWVIERCAIRQAKSVGLDCGSEGGRETMEYPQAPWTVDHHNSLKEAARQVGHHLIRNNDISDNGHCGIAGIGHYGTHVVANRIERNNCDGWTSPWWEFAGIKFHFFFDGLIEGNLIRDNETHGIWLDNQWRGSRVTRNVIVNNAWSGINMELGRGPCTIDHNIIAHTRHGDGVYGHDAADITIAHNLIYANANFGVWFAFGTPRVKPEDGCWQISTRNNLILGNRAGAVAYPLPWEAAGDNVSDGNLFMGGGDYLDEGGGPQQPMFQLTNLTHMATMQQFLDFPAMSVERLQQMLTEQLDAAGVDADRRPNLQRWTEHCLLPLDLWQAAMSCDANSRTISVIRDGFNARRLAWHMPLTEAIDDVTCHPVEGLDSDYFGNPLPAEGARPGPFQDLGPDDHEILVWPAPVITAESDRA